MMQVWRPTLPSSRSSWHPYPGDGGCIQVRSYVASTDELAQLERVVAGNNPPLPIHYDIQVSREWFQATSTDR
ncbi:MAG: hypothetical protein N2C12_11640 [Planctomycetales bacterium]